MTRKSTSAVLDHPLRKLILAVMATALAALFLTSFLDRTMVQGTKTARTQAKSKGLMAVVPDLMAKLQQNPMTRKPS